jgi:hypothetical protein
MAPKIVGAMLLVVLFGHDNNISCGLYVYGAMLRVVLFGRTSRKQKYGKIKMKAYYAKVPRPAPDCWNYF